MVKLIIIIKKKRTQSKHRNNNNGIKKPRIKTQPGQNLDGTVRCTRLLLNDAIKDVTNMEGWSEARKNAFKHRETNPNSYYYRFNDVGQDQRNGKWTKEEHKIFMERLLECGANEEWGVFSRPISGRVGYQCSNYYRQLIKESNISDPNYIISKDRKKLDFVRGIMKDKIGDKYRRYIFTVHKDTSGVFSPLPAQHPKRPTEDEIAEVLSTIDPSKKSKKSSKKNDNNDNIDNKEDNIVSNETPNDLNNNNTENITEKKKKKKKHNHLKKLKKKKQILIMMMMQNQQINVEELIIILVKEKKMMRIMMKHLK